MSFDEILSEMVESTGGAEACFMFDRDGILIQSATAPGVDIDLAGVGAEVSAILKTVQLAAESMEMGVVEELSFTAATRSVFLRNIQDEYHVAIVLKPGANVGKGRYVLQSRAVRLRSEI